MKRARWGEGYASRCLGPPLGRLSRWGWCNSWRLDSAGTPSLTCLMVGAAVGWDLGGGVRTATGGPSTPPLPTKLGFLTAWQLGSKNESSERAKWRLEHLWWPDHTALYHFWDGSQAHPVSRERNIALTPRWDSMWNWRHCCGHHCHLIGCKHTSLL